MSTPQSNQADLAIRNAHCVLPSPDDPSALVTVQTSVAIKDGRYPECRRPSARGRARNHRRHGASRAPRVIDSQVHFREPGLTHKEDLETGTRGAALGGVTAVFEMPNTKPSTTTAEAFREKLQLAEGRVWTDISFFIGASPENIDQLAELEKHPNCCAIKIFMGSSTGTLLIEEDSNLLKILQRGHRRVAVHAEDEARLRERRASRRRKK